MNLSREEKRQIVNKINHGELSIEQVVKEYGVSKRSVYRWLKNPPEVKKKPYKPSSRVIELVKKENEIDISVYQNMTKDELIDELILSKINELRAKKGYEVRGVGANKEFIFLNNENSK